MRGQTDVEYLKGMIWGFRVWVLWRIPSFENLEGGDGEKALQEIRLILVNMFESGFLLGIGDKFCGF